MNSNGSGNSEKTLKALRSIGNAHRERLLAGRHLSGNPARSKFHADYAQDLLEEANTLLTPAEPVKITIGGEALPALENRLLDGVREALLDPDTIALDASASRLELLADADAVSLGVDAAESIQAHDSLEKMLVHQMAAAHKHSLRLMAKIPHAADNLEALRITNASVRLMLAYQLGIKVLQKIRSGGRQVVIVQHVQVSEGGQAVIAGEVQNRSGGGNSEEA
jgi:hypothetical protein